MWGTHTHTQRDYRTSKGCQEVTSSTEGSLPRVINHTGDLSPERPLYMAIYVAHGLPATSSIDSSSVVLKASYIPYRHTRSFTTAARRTTDTA